jgi:hypothetical protein
MTQSFANIQPNFLELTPCRVTYKGVDVGATLGNVVVKISDKLSDLKADQLGTTIVDKRVSGQVYTVEFEIAQVQEKTNWKILFPPHQLVEQGGNTGFYFDAQIGYSMRSGAGQLVLHPLSKADTDKSEDFLFYLAASEVTSDFGFSPTEQVKMKCTMTIYPDFTTQPSRFFFFGDPAIDLVPASAAAAVAGTGNVGNGTVSGITAFSGVTKTETVSMQCVTAGTGGSFYVLGSSSGPLGLATVGIGFNASGGEIAFLINNGGTPFAVNDSFTIATTAANYG